MPKELKIKFQARRKIETGKESENQNYHKFQKEGRILLKTDEGIKPSLRVPNINN